MADFRGWLRPARLETREARCVLTVSNATRRPHRSGGGAFIPFTGFASGAVRFNGRARRAEPG
jgi:hypothetical protein